MTQETWSAVDEYFLPLVGEDAALREATVASHEGGLPPIQVAPNQGKLLYMLATLRGARNILEVGTLGGYSTIWLARALPPDGQLVTLELNPDHAKVATRNIARAGFASVVSVIVGSAKDSLARLVDAGEAPFDFIFIDADKDSNAVYLDAALKLSRPGTVIVVDNVVRGGRVADQGPAVLPRQVDGFRLRRLQPMRQTAAIVLELAAAGKAEGTCELVGFAR